MCAPAGRTRFIVSMIFRCPRCRPSKFPIESTPPSGTCLSPSIPWCTFIGDAYNTRKTRKESNMRISAALLILCFSSNVFGAIKTQTVQYKHGDVVLEGYLAWDDATGLKRPGVIVVHEWWGNNDYAHKRAEMLAQL